jgi:hypothetical protein
MMPGARLSLLSLRSARWFMHIQKHFKSSLCKARINHCHHHRHHDAATRPLTE